MNFRKFLVLFLCFTLLTGCGNKKKAAAAQQSAGNAPASSSALTQKTNIPQPDPVDSGKEAAGLADAPPAAVATVLKPMPSASLRETGNDGIIDYSHKEDGYVMAKFTTVSSSRLKVLVKGPTTTYSYNLPCEEWAVFPLSDGSGSYQVGIYQNVTGSKYAKLLTVTFSVTLNDEFAPFLRPNQYVNYSEATQAVDLGLELTQGIEQPLEKVAAVYDYVVTTLSYDHDKAATVKSGYLPDLDQVLESKKGICFDYAALMTAMLRSQDVPCKLVVGYAGSVYHAWISVWTQEYGWVDGAIFFDGQVWTRMDPTFASSGSRSEEIMQFINNGNYTTKYLY